MAAVFENKKGDNMTGKSRWIAMLMLSGLLSACASFDKCGFSGCTGDEAITLAVKERLNNSPAYKGDLLRVQTLDGVVYVNGLVSSDYEYFELVGFLKGIPGVTKVVNNTGVQSHFR
jgi:osmotically-inducible protein OsmY